jgi:hypothetical protein
VVVAAVTAAAKEVRIDAGAATISTRKTKVAKDRFNLAYNYPALPYTCLFCFSSWFSIARLDEFEFMTNRILRCYGNDVS